MTKPNQLQLEIAYRYLQNLSDEIAAAYTKECEKQGVTFLGDSPLVHLLHEVNKYASNLSYYGNTLPETLNFEVMVKKNGEYFTASCDRVSADSRSKNRAIAFVLEALAQKCDSTLV